MTVSEVAAAATGLLGAMGFALLSWQFIGSGVRALRQAASS